MTIRWRTRPKGTEGTMSEYIGRNEAIKRIREALQRRSGKVWSVTGGRGTAWGWITIDSPPRRRTSWYRTAPVTGEQTEVHGCRPGGHTSPSDREELCKLLDLEFVYRQGVRVPSSLDYYREYIDRAEGVKPTVIGEPYWD
jgi:hypothetical protein